MHAPAGAYRWAQWRRGGLHAIWSVAVMMIVAAAALMLTTNLSPLRAQSSDEAAGEPAIDEPLGEPQLFRFVTDDDFPPFNYVDEDGVLTGFNVDVARALCLELDLTCDVSALPWDELMPALTNGEADAAIASIAVTPETVEEVDFTEPYYFTPGRFAARRGATVHEMTPAGLEGERVGVVAQTTHEAFLNVLFKDSVLVLYPNHDTALEALKSGEVPYLFGDAVSLAFWLNGTSSGACCEFRGNAYQEPQFFGPGISVAVRKGNAVLRRDLNRALNAIRSAGRLEELFLRYFPIRVYD